MRPHQPDVLRRCAARAEARARLDKIGFDLRRQLCRADNLLFFQIAVFKNDLNDLSRFMAKLRHIPQLAENQFVVSVL